MQDNQALTYSRPVTRRHTATASDLGLLSAERMQKLDLLLHLLANLHKGLVLCGPTGIGKTTLLTRLQRNTAIRGDVCLMPGSADLSFEAIITQLNRFLKLGSTSFSAELAALRQACAVEKVVLVIDDAGGLMPGLLNELLALAESMPGFRVVVAMTHDDYHLKQRTDTALDDCHLIELPALSQSQCREFLENLSLQADSPLAMGAITEPWVETVYRQTHGIPGKIVAQLPALTQQTPATKRPALALWLGVGAVVIAALSAMVVLLPATDTPIVATEPSVLPEPAVEAIPEPDTLQPNPPEVPAETLAPTAQLVAAEPQEAPLVKVAPLANPELETLSPAPLLPMLPALGNRKLLVAKSTLKPQPPLVPVIKTPLVAPPAIPLALLPTLATPNLNKPLDSKPQDIKPIAQPKPVEPKALETRPLETKSPDTQPVAETPAREKPVETKPTEAKPLERAQPAASVDTGDLEWVMAQPPQNVTLQLLVLSNKGNLNRLLNSYSNLRDQLKYYTTRRNGQEKYILIYGSFASSEAAQQQKAQLPSEIRQAVVNRFAAVQAEASRDLRP